MDNAEWRKPCATGCTCGKHRARKNVHPENCSCAVHARKPCTGEPGCPCGHHASTKCKPGCTCKRHRSRATPEQKAATRERAREWNRAYAKRVRDADPEGRRAEQREYRRNNPEITRNHHLKSKFGITLLQWEAMYAEQSEACYLCGDPMDRFDVHIDHSHGCCPGKKSCGSCVRGLACRWCNQGVGQFRDDPARMRRVADALEHATERVQLAARA